MRIFLAASFLMAGTLSLAAQEMAPQAMMAEYKVNDYSNLLGMPGFKDELLKMHFQLYKGYVQNTNLLLKSLRDYSMKTPLDTYTFGALKRRFGWEFDGMRLHEFYFGNLGGKAPLPNDSPLYNAITNQFGSYEKWKSDFVATAMMRGIGWVILYRDPETDRLMNVWIAEHDLGHLAGCELILVLDVWEHAYLTQFGLDRASYIDTFFKNIDWDAVQSRFTTQ